MRRRAHAAAFACLALGCGDHFTVEVEMDAAVDAARSEPLEGGGLEERCAADDPCRVGLACRGGRCLATGDAGEDEPCLLSVECERGLRCGWGGFCVPAGEGRAGDACSTSGECAADLYCELVGGAAGQCAPIAADAADLDEPCEGDAQCMSGLVCSPTRGTCQPGSVLLNPGVYRGVACDDESGMDFGVRHRLPDPDNVRFYHFPFPTDVRVSEGRPDVTTHPVPGPELSGSDLVAKVVAAMSEELTGWGVLPGVYFRFTRAVDPDSLLGAIRFVNLETGETRPFEHQFVEAGGKYICPNHLFVHPGWARPLEEDTAYAVVVTDAVRPAVGDDAPAQLDVLSALLADAEPGDAATRRAWGVYAPLRAWLDREGVERGSVVGATVFTTGATTGVVRALREAAHGLDAPRLVGEPVRCGGGAVSPCATPDFEPSEAMTSDPRACPGEADERFHEVHAKIRLPNFQAGEPPYRVEGGSVTPPLEPVRHEEVCMVITVPTTEMPAAGWPVVLYAHGTGGNFRAGRNLLAPTLSSLGEGLGVAMVGIDQSMHGPRQGAAPWDAPGPLFFNIENPRAARGNAVQGAADNFSLVRWLRVFDDTLPGVGRVRFDSGHVYYDGHSQGATTGPLFLPFEPDLRGVALSGAAGSLVFSFLDKKSPYDASTGLVLALHELTIGEAHPVLHLFQQYFEAADPLAYAPLYLRNPPKHLLHIYGRDDTFTPDRGQRAFAAALGATLGVPDDPPPGFDRVEDLGMATTPLPVEGNVERDGTAYTVVTVQHFPEADDQVGEGTEPYDGHFVIYRDPDAIDDLKGFLGSLLAGGVPRVE